MQDKENTTDPVTPSQQAEPTQPAIPQPHVPWHNSWGFLIFWLVVFAPIGLLGLWKSNLLKTPIKWVLAALSICWSVYYHYDSWEAHQEGYDSASDMKESKSLNMRDATDYYLYVEKREKNRTSTIEKEKKEKELAKFNSLDFSNGAYWACQEIVKQKLVSPASANFPTFAQSMSPKANQEYLLSSYVDSQNQFGAPLRTAFICSVKYKSTSTDETSQYMIDNWEVMQLVFDK